MKRSLLPILLLLLLCCCCSPDREYVQLSGPAQGGSYLVKLCARDASCTPGELKQGVDSILLAIDNSVSGYNPSSILSRFNAGEKVEPDSVFRDLYLRSRDLWERSGGTVDVAAGPLFDIWGFGFRDGSLPSDSLVQAVSARCGMALLPSGIDSLVSCRPEGTVLNFNCIAQGYSSDCIAGYLRARGVRDFLVDVGGEIVCQGLNPKGENWAVGIDRPVDGNLFPGNDMEGVYRPGTEPCGIVTSGNYRKFYVIDGRKYSHTIDPRSGRPVNHSLLSATVVAPDATLADAMATCCMVLGLEGASRLIEESPELEACLIYDDGQGRLKEWCSPGFVLSER